jgi:hypothetical protein
VQSYAERRGITFRERVAEIVRRVVPEKVRNMFDGLRSPSDMPGPEVGRRPELETPEKEMSGKQAERRETEAPERKVAADPEAEARRHARGRWCAIPAPWMRSSRRKSWAARQVPRR